MQVVAVGKEFDPIPAQFRTAQRETNIATAKNFGVKDPAAIIDSYEKAVEKWRAKSKEIGRDIDKFADGDRGGDLRQGGSGEDLSLPARVAAARRDLDDGVPCGTHAMNRLLALARQADQPDVLGRASRPASLMMLHVTIDVTGRYLFNRPLEGTTEIVAAYYMVVIAYAPWAWIAARDNHIVAGMFQNVGTPRFDYWIEIVVKIFTAFYVAVFTYQTCLQALRQTRAGEVWLAGTMYHPGVAEPLGAAALRRLDAALSRAARDPRRRARLRQPAKT